MMGKEVVALAMNGDVNAFIQYVEEKQAESPTPVVSLQDDQVIVFSSKEKKEVFSYL